MSESKQTFQKSLGLLDATMLVVGSMIGSGIFIVSADIARNREYIKYNDHTGNHVQ